MLAPSGAPLPEVAVQAGAARMVVDQSNQQDARNPGPGRAPAEKIQRTRHQFRHDLFLRLGIHRRSEGRVDPVEEIQETDPQHARDDVNPAQAKLDGAVLHRSQGAGALHLGSSAGQSGDHGGLSRFLCGSLGDEGMRATIRKPTRGVNRAAHAPQGFLKVKTSARVPFGSSVALAVCLPYFSCQAVSV